MNYSNTYEEAQRILAQMTKLDPSSEKYGTLMARYKSLCATYIAFIKADLENVKQNEDSTRWEMEFKAKHDKEKLDDAFRKEELDHKIKKAEQDETFRSRELDHKIKQDALDEEFRQKEMDLRIDESDEKTVIENNKIQMEQNRLDAEYAKIEVERERNSIEQEKIKTDKTKLVNEDIVQLIKSGSDILQTSMKIAGGVLVSRISAKVMLALAKSIVSEEEKGNLVYSKILGLIQKPNLWNMKLF